MPGALVLPLLVPLFLLPADWNESLPQTRAFSSAGYEAIVRTPEVTVHKDQAARTVRLGADARVAAPAEAVLAALIDYEGQVGVMGNLAECRVLSRGQGWQLAYERIRMPVVSDRDFTVRVTWGREGSLRWLRYWNDESSGQPPRKGLVRVPYHRGSWQLLPVENGRATQIRYQVSIDLGGWLPRWIARRSAGKEVQEMFRSLCTLLARRGQRAAPCLLR